MSRRSTRSTAKASGGNGEATSSKVRIKHGSKSKCKDKAKAENNNLTFRLDDPVQSASEYGEPVTDQRRRRKRTKYAAKPKKRSRWTKAIPSGAGETTSNPAGEDTMVSLSIEDLTVNLDDSTKIPNHFRNLCGGRKLRAIAPPNYTPNLDEATHILELPFYDPDTRHYELIEDGFSLLQDQEMFDGGLSNIWRVQARNIQRPEEDVVNLFIMHTTVVSRSRCPCRLVLNSGLCNATENSACSSCIQFKIAVENPPREPQNLDRNVGFRCC